MLTKAKLAARNVTRFVRNTGRWFVWVVLMRRTPWHRGVRNLRSVAGTIKFQVYVGITIALYAIVMPAVNRWADAHSPANEIAWFRAHEMERTAELIWCSNNPDWAQMYPRCEFAKEAIR